MTKFTTKSGSMQFEVQATSTWTTISGLIVTTHRVNVYNPNTGHGWNGIMSDKELKQWMAMAR